MAMTFAVMVCDSPSDAARLTNLLGKTTAWSSGPPPDLAFANGSQAEFTWVNAVVNSAASVSAAGSVTAPAPQTITHSTQGSSTLIKYRGGK